MTQSNDTPSSAPPPGASTPPNSLSPSIAAPGLNSPAFALDDRTRDVFVEHAHALLDAANRLQDRQDKALFLSEAGEVDERVRGDELSAAKSFLAAVNSFPRYRAPLEALVRMYLRRRSANNLLKLAEALVKAAAQPRAKAEALCLKAEILEDRIADPAAAKAAYEEAAELDPSYRLAWMSLERIGRRSDDGALARKSTLRLAELTSDSARKARLLTEVARDLAKEGSDDSLEQASTLFREAATLPLGRWRALVEFERFALATGRSKDLVFALEAMADLAQRAVEGEFEGGSGVFSVAHVEKGASARAIAADLWARAARVRSGVLDDPTGALTALDAALALAPEDTRLWIELPAIADRAGEIGRSADAARWLTERSAVEPSMKAGLLFRLAEAAASEGDGAKATALLREVIALVPEGAAAHAALFDQLVAAGDAAGAVAEIDRLAEAEQSKKLRASLFRAGAGVCLAMQGDADGARRRLAQAADSDANDTFARRAWLALLPGRPEADVAQRAVNFIDALLAASDDSTDKGALLTEKLWLERAVLDRPAAATVEALGRAGEPWALPLALVWNAAAGAYAPAARLADELLATADDNAPRADLAATSARLHLAAGDDRKAREVALAAHKQDPEDPFAATLAFRLALAVREPVAAFDVLDARGAKLDDAAAARWLTVGAVFLANAGATVESRRALERASERDPASPAVRAALLATTRWRSDSALRERLADAAVSSPDGGDEETALGVQLVLARLFLEHDKAGAADALERVNIRAGADSLAVSLLSAIVTGSRLGPDAPDTVTALQSVLGAMPANDPLRNAFELEVARALSSSADTADQARDMRELLEDESRGSAAPRLLALLDAIQREDRRDLSVALSRVADGADEVTAAALRSAALAALRAQGRDAEARTFALQFESLPASVVALSELGANLDHAAARSRGLDARAKLATPGAERTALERRSAVWASIAGKNEEAVASASALVKIDPSDAASWDVVRVSARRLGQWQRVVEACTALAKLSKDSVRAAVLWEEAGVTLFDQLEKHREAERPLLEAIQRDPTRDMAYKRLRMLLEARKDHVNLEALVTLRLSAEQAELERVGLLWEQARFRRALGMREEALESAMQVVEKEPEHVAALALLAEVHATSGRLEEAAEALVALSAARETPASQRRVARQGAIDIFEHRLKQPQRAIELLERMVIEGEANDATVERGVALATTAGLWDASLRFARVAADRAQTPAERCKTLLRVCEIQRDKVKDRAGALVAARAAHEVLPSELAALRAVHGLADEAERAQRARRTIEALREWIRSDGPAGEAARRVALAAELGGDPVLTRTSLRVARAMGEDVPVVAAGVPSGRVTLKDAALALRVRNPNDTGAAAALIDTVMPDLAELAGISTDGFNVGRADRVKGASPYRDAATPYATVAGVGEFDLYVGGNDDNRIAVIPGSTPALVLGKRVPQVFDEALRFRVARAFLLAVRGVSAMDPLGVDGTVDCLVAAMVAADLPIVGGTTRIEARLRPVAKALSRRARKATADIAKPISGLADPWSEIARGVRAVFSTARRGALSVTGAVPAAFGDITRTDPSDSVRRDLVLFALSDGLASVSRETGVDRG
jgi:tetratricopeptide (TPR) repeat protein